MHWRLRENWQGCGDFSTYSFSYYFLIKGSWRCYLLPHYCCLLCALKCHFILSIILWKICFVIRLWTEINVVDHIFVIKLTWSYLFQVSICWEIKGFSEHVRVLGSEGTRVVCLQWYLFTEMYEEPTNGVVERLSRLFVPNQGRLSLIGHTHRWEKSNNINVNKTSILRPFLSVRCG